VAPSRRIGVYCQPNPALLTESLGRLDGVFKIT